jgi:hypothetical protein
MVLAMTSWILPVLLAVMTLIIFWAVGCYNRLQRLRHAALSALQHLVASIGARNQLVMNVLTTLDGNLQHERAALAEVHAALHRSTAVAEAAGLTRGDARTLQTLDAGEVALGMGLWNLRNLSAAYPELVVNVQLNAQWHQLDGALAGAEFAREQFNAASIAYAQACGEKPAAWLARIMRLPAVAHLRQGASVSVAQ